MKLSFLKTWGFGWKCRTSFAAKIRIKRSYLAWRLLSIWQIYLWVQWVLQERGYIEWNRKLKEFNLMEKTNWETHPHTFLPTWLCWYWVIWQLKLEYTHKIVINSPNLTAFISFSSNKIKKLSTFTSNLLIGLIGTKNFSLTEIDRKHQFKRD